MSAYCTILAKGSDVQTTVRNFINVDILVLWMKVASALKRFGTYNFILCSCIVSCSSWTSNAVWKIWKLKLIYITKFYNWAIFRLLLLQSDLTFKYVYVCVSQATRLYQDSLGSSIVLPRIWKQGVKIEDLWNFGGHKSVTQFTRIIITTLYIDTARQVCFLTSFNVPIVLYE